MEYGPIDGNLWGTARPFFLGCVALADLEAGANRSETCASLTHLVSSRHTSISDVASLDQTRPDQTKPQLRPQPRAFETRVLLTKGGKGIRKMRRDRNKNDECEVGNGLPGCCQSC
jgi:hypothetical protein